MTDLCTAPKCPRRAQAKDLCITHYNQQKNGRPFTELSPEAPCKFEGCGRVKNTQGYCKSHYRQWKNDEELTPIKTPQKPECSVEGCTFTPRVGKLCITHYEARRTN